MSEWNLIEAWIVTIPSINVATGELGPKGRLVVASEARAKEVCDQGPKHKDGTPVRTYVKATEENLTQQEIAGLRRAKAEAASGT